MQSLLTLNKHWLKIAIDKGCEHVGFAPIFYWLLQDAKDLQMRTDRQP
jgi:hypothetical protein